MASPLIALNLPSPLAPLTQAGGVAAKASAGRGFQPQQNKGKKGALGGGGGGARPVDVDKIPHLTIQIAGAAAGGGGRPSGPAGTYIVKKQQMRQNQNAARRFGNNAPARFGGNVQRPQQRPQQRPAQGQKRRQGGGGGSGGAIRVVKPMRRK
jgi:hypothetical protein